MIRVDVELDELRGQASGSYRFRKGRDTLTAAQWLDLPVAHRAGWKWGPDEQVVKRLDDAERAHTQRVAAGRAVSR